MSIYFCPRINTKIYIEGLEEKIKNIEMKWFERLGNFLNKKLPLQLIVTQDIRGSIQTDFFYILLCDQKGSQTASAAQVSSMVWHMPVKESVEIQMN